MSVSCKTKQYYSTNYKEYISTTQNIDMTDHYRRFLPYLSQGAKILDIGFGSGRDLLYFVSKGYNVWGVDNVSEFVEKAKENGLNVELCDFHNLPYIETFDGIWACASLLHSNNLPLAFDNLNKALKVGGYIYLSMKYGKGTNIEDGRFYQYIDEEKLKELCKNSNLSIVEIYNSEDLLKRNNGWINAVLRKI
ncbi:MAG: class I SAM-dependent methyltransferase [Clostridia bacterium]|nr:class I SAM-dependent methyltransferase [Clostridia bacterium]